MLCDCNRCQIDRKEALLKEKEREKRIIINLTKDKMAYIKGLPVEYVKQQYICAKKNVKKCKETGVSTYLCDITTEVWRQCLIRIN